MEVEKDYEFLEEKLPKKSAVGNPKFFQISTAALFFLLIVWLEIVFYFVWAALPIKKTAIGTIFSPYILIRN